MLAGNLRVTRRREPPLALTTIEGFFQIYQIALRHQRFLVHFVWDLNGLTLLLIKHGMLAKGNLFSCHFSALHVRF